MNKNKAFEIPKILVWKAYLGVKSKRGCPGVDGETIATFDENRDRNLYKIWNRLSSGTYFPPPVLARDIPKSDGSTRTLGIPTVADRIAQGAAKIFLEKIIDPHFDDDSYGYRPGRSSHQAIRKTWYRTNKKFWLLEVDIKKFFDNMNHDLVIKALEHFKVPRWIILYCNRWMKAAIKSGEGIVSSRSCGTPQGGVISPLLANIFLHFAIDKWLRKHWTHVDFARYADDLVLHCRNRKEAINLRNSLKLRLKEVLLEMNLEKSNLVYLGTYSRWNVKYQFTFLGYDFMYRTLKDSRSGILFRKIAPGASKQAMKKITKEIGKWRIHRSTEADIIELAQRFNPAIRGWINYFGKFWYRNFSYRVWSVLQSRLIKWAKSKFKIGHKKAVSYLRKAQIEKPRLFAHWYLLQGSNV